MAPVNTAAAGRAPSFAAPVVQAVALPSGEVVVRSATVQQLLAARTALTPALERLAEAAPGLLDLARLDLIRASGQITANDLRDLCVLLDEADAAVDITAALTDVPRERLLAMQPDEFVYLFAVAMQVNADFFVQALPALTAGVQALEALGKPPGGTSSSPPPSAR